MKIKAREIKPLDILITRTFLHGEERMKVHFTAPSFRDSTKVNAYGFDGESVMFDADMTVEVIRGGFPTKPGQAVRSELDGTLGVTISRVRQNGLITVIFVGSVTDGPFKAADLTVVDVEEVKP